MDSSLYQPITIINSFLLQSACKKIENFFNVVAVAAVLRVGFNYTVKLNINKIILLRLFNLNYSI